MQKLLQAFILVIFLAGLSTTITTPPIVQAENACSLRGAKVGNNLVFFISSPNFTGNSGTDLPRVTVGSYISFNEYDGGGAPTNLNWSDAQGKWNPYNQTWSFTLTPDMPGYEPILSAASSDGGIVLDGRTGDSYCSDDDDYSYTISTNQTIETKCYTTTADVYTSPACQEERDQYLATLAQNNTPNTNLDQSISQSIGQSAAEAAQKAAQISKMCSTYSENTSNCPSLASQCLENNNPENCLAKEMCELEKGSVYAALFRDPKGTSCFTLTEFIPTLLSYFMMFAAIIAGFLFVWAGYKYLTSKGDPSALADAKDMIMQVIIGLVILSLAFVIIQVLGSAFSGVDDSILLI